MSHSWTAHCSNEAVLSVSLFLFSFFLSLPACISVISRYKCLKNNLFDLFKKSQLDPISTSPQVSS